MANPNILAALGAALQGGQQTYAQVSQDEEQRKRLAQQMELQQAQFASQQRLLNDNRLEKRISNAIEGANENTEFSAQDVTDANRFGYGGALKRSIGTDTVQGKRPGMNFTPLPNQDELNVVGPSGPNGDNTGNFPHENEQKVFANVQEGMRGLGVPRMQTLQGADSKVTRQFSPEEEQKRTQARTITQLMQELNVTPQGPGTESLSQVPGAPVVKPSPTALTPNERKRAGVAMAFPGSANEVLGPVPTGNNAPFDISQVGSGEDALKGVPPAMQDIIKAVADYRFQLPAGKAITDPMFKEILARTMAYDPSFSAAEYQVRQRLRTDFTSGKNGNNIKSLNTVISHLGDLSGKADAMHNWQSPTANAVGNFFQSEVAGDPRVTGFDGAAHAVESEAASLFKGMGATDQEIKAWRATLSHNMSPEQFKESFSTMIGLMKGRMEGLENQYSQGMRKPRDFGFLTQHSREILNQLGTDADAFDPLSKDKPWQGVSPAGGVQDVSQHPVGQQQAPAPGNKTASVAEVNAYARAKGVTPVQAAQALQAKGYTIGR